MPMQVLALALVVPQPVSGGKVGYDFNFEHRRISAGVTDSC